MKLDSKQEINAFLENYFLDLTQQGEKIDNFSYRLLSGKTEELDSNQGKILFLNFWATWCVPCKKEMPDMEELHHLLKDTQFRIISISYSEEEKKVKEFIDLYPYSFDIALDSDGKIGTKLGVSGLPTTYILDKNLNIIAKAMGPRKWQDKSVIAFLKKISG
ncbi:MAG: TlpA family protein disulfide reductase [Deltaproteobacteria bacterium]|nr:TlpA family protein disulfide reductase [Deltaproteobacteria bacterium]